MFEEPLLVISIFFGRLDWELPELVVVRAGSGHCHSWYEYRAHFHVLPGTSRFSLVSTQP